MSSPSSSRTPPVHRIEAPDDTYKSLASLLASPAISASSHIDLIPAAGLSSSISYYLSTLPTDEVAQFAKLLVSSNAIWSSQSSLLQRSILLFEATARAVLARIQVIVAERNGSLNWSTRRTLVKYIRAISDAIHLDEASIPSCCNGVPVPTFSLHTGLLAGLQAAKAQRAQKRDQSLDVRYALDKAEDEWCVTLAECLDPLARQKESLDEWEAEFKEVNLAGNAVQDSSSVKIATLHLAAQVAPFVPSKKVTALPGNAIISVLSETILALFEESRLLDSIREDVSPSEAGQLTLKAVSATAVRSSALTSHPLYSLMGPLSRMLSLALSHSIRTLSPVQVQETFTESGSLMSRMQALASQWQSKWLSSRLAGAAEEDIEATTQTQTKQLWNCFKTLLFSYTMIFDALMEAIVDVSPSPTLTLPPNPTSIASASGRWPASSTSNIPLSYLNLTTDILVIYSHLSWITASFGSTAFDAYRRVFFEALEVLARDSQACINLVERVAPDSNRLQVNAGRRATATYYMDVVEQSMAALPDEMVVQKVLPFVKDYIEHAEFKDSFESAHSVILAIFATQKSCVCELAAYYIELLLACFPTHLNESQLTHAYSTVVSATSDKSDTVTWFALDTLWNAIEAERLRVNSTTSSTDIETSILRRRQLSNVYIAQLPNINLVLLRSMLRKVRLLILQEQMDTDERKAICEKVFDSLAGLDASTREEGLRWWLEERKSFGV